MGALLSERFGDPGKVSSKSTATDLVSQTDVDAEDLIRRALAEARPDDAIMGEEGDDVAGTSGRRWIVDPLDGTINFLFGIPQWSVSIALEGICGVVFDPSRDECWSVGDGEPMLNGEPITPSGRADMATALVATGFGYDAEVRRVQGAIVARLLPQVRDIRRAGSAALDLAWTAAGRYDAYFERGVHAWDVEAGAQLCRAAGLEVHDLGPIPPSTGGILVAPTAFAQQLLDAVGDR